MAAQKLPQYDPGRTCPKCEHDKNIGTQYVERGGEEWGTPKLPRDVDAALVRTCPRCGYAWLEQTRDAK